jgi:hypothetical protein
MPVSVTAFVSEKYEQIKNMKGFDSLMSELAMPNKKKTVSISNDMIAKKILSNAYGTPVDDSLCLAFRKYAYANTDFVEKTR